VGRGTLARVYLVRLVDAHDLLRARLEAVFVELLHLNALSLRLIDVFGVNETFLLQADSLFLQGFDLCDLCFDLLVLYRVELAKVYLRVLTSNVLSRLETPLLEDFAARLLQHAVDLVLNGLADLSLALRSSSYGCVTFSLRRERLVAAHLARVGCHEKRAAVFPSRHHIILLLQVLEHVGLLEVALVEVEELLVYVVDVF